MLHPQRYHVYVTKPRGHYYITYAESPEAAKAKVERHGKRVTRVVPVSKEEGFQHDVRTFG